LWNLLVEKDFFFLCLPLTFGLRSSSLGPAAAAAAAVVEVEPAAAVGALLALAASLSLCFSRRLSSLQIKIHRSKKKIFQKRKFNH
jgi:hypothetical protein